jgi:hypothetical protein
LLTPQRRIFASRWFAAGAGLAVAIALPSALWQAAHGFPMWELLQNDAYLLLIAQMIALRAKHYYPADIYPVLIAAGGVAIEAWTRGRFVARAAVALAACAAGLVFVPFVLPVLSEPSFIAYEARIGAVLHLDRRATATEHQAESRLPQDWADMHGWPELAATVARAYAALPPSERAHAAIFAHNYGEAAALDFFGPRYGLPPASSGHNQYWLWGPHGWDGATILDVGGRVDEDRRNCCEAVLAAVAQLWPRERVYI